MKRKLIVPLTLAAAVACLFFFQIEMASSQWSSFSFNASDPGVRGGAAGAGGQLAGLSGTQAAFFTAGAVDFAEEEKGPDGLGPRMNLDSCGWGPLIFPPFSTTPIFNHYLALYPKS